MFFKKREHPKIFKRLIITLCKHLIRCFHQACS